MNVKKPVPTQAASKRGLCPVCGKPSYSLTGTHPQCAVARADAVTRAAYKASIAASEASLQKTQTKG